MAKIIEFHIPKSFSTCSKSLPPSGLGKLLEFPIRSESPETSNASAQRTAFAQGEALPALLCANASQNRECGLPLSLVSYGFCDLDDPQV